MLMPMDAGGFIKQTINKWQLLRLLGEGSFGAVYEAAHTDIEGKRAAVKILHPHLAVNVSIKRRFLNEASAASRAEHENIVQIFDGGITSDGVCYAVMELLRGVTLSRLIDRDRLDLARTINIGIQMAGALAAAHELGIIHRDLKPENIFIVSRVTNAEFVKVLDFGIAKLRDPLNAEDGKLTSTGMQLGTPGYMSPEQWMTFPDIDGRADIYALGVILYECLTKELPFSASNRFAWQQAHLHQAAPDLSTNPAVGPVMAKFIARMLAKRREDRPQQMLEVIQDLRAITGVQPGWQKSWNQGR